MRLRTTLAIMAVIGVLAYSVNTFGWVSTLFGGLMVGCVIFGVVIAVLGIAYETKHGKKVHWSSTPKRNASGRSSGSRRSSGGGGRGSSSSRDDFSFTDLGD